MKGLVSLALELLIRSPGPTQNASTRNIWAHCSMLSVPLTAQVGAFTVACRALHWFVGGRHAAKCLVYKEFSVDLNQISKRL